MKRILETKGLKINLDRATAKQKQKLFEINEELCKKHFPNFKPKKVDKPKEEKKEE